MPLICIVIGRGLGRAVDMRAMFETGHDAARRAAFRAEPADAPALVAIALHGPRKDADKVTKGASLRP